MASLRAPDGANKTFQITASKHGWGFTKSYFMVINTSVQGFLVLMGFTQSMKFIWSTFWIQVSPVQTWEVPTKINFHCTRLLPSTSLSIWVWNLSIYKNKHFPHNILCFLNFLLWFWLFLFCVLVVLVGVDQVDHPPLISSGAKTYIQHTEKNW